MYVPITQSQATFEHAGIRYRVLIGVTFVPEVPGAADSPQEPDWRGAKLETPARVSIPTRPTPHYMAHYDAGDWIFRPEEHVMYPSATDARTVDDIVADVRSTVERVLLALDAHTASTAQQAQQPA